MKRISETLLIFLGILVLVAALLVVYIESKNREQNHKISAMLSLVSSLAEEVNAIKFGVSQLSFTGGNNSQYNQFFENIPKESTLETPLDNSNFETKTKLITVSDDDEDDDNSDSESENSDLESVVSSNSSNSDDNNLDVHSLSEEHNDVKVLKINITGNFENDNSSREDIENLDFNGADDLDELDELDDNLSDNQSVSSKSSIECVDNLLSLQHNNTNISNIDENIENEENKNHEILDISSSDFKTINITLEESNTENIDYKKLSLPKLRSIVTEKGLHSDPSKLKKNELFKLLGIE